MFSFLSFGRWKISDFVCHAVMSCFTNLSWCFIPRDGFSEGQGEGERLDVFLVSILAGKLGYLLRGYERVS